MTHTLPVGFMRKAPHAFYMRRYSQSLHHQISSFLTPCSLFIQQIRVLGRVLAKCWSLGCWCPLFSAKQNWSMCFYNEIAQKVIRAFC